MASYAQLWHAFRSMGINLINKGQSREKEANLMREYELTYIVHPDLDENALKDVIEKTSSWITESGGEVLKIDLWGRRKLAYSIRKQNEGQYVYTEVKMEPQFCRQLERNLRLLEPVMRYLLILKDE